MDKEKQPSTNQSRLRKLAEKLLDQKMKGSVESMSESKYLKLIRELEVHQIELELQNEELLLAKEKAESAEKKYTELFDISPSGCITLTREGKITELNKSAVNMLGKKPHLIQSNFGFFVTPDTRAGFNGFLQKIFIIKDNQNCEFNLDTGNGIVKHISAKGIISENNDNCLVTLTDNTKQKLTEIELIKAKEVAEEADRLKSAFLANMSHEIRTPMNGILGFTELLKTIDLNTDDQQSYISIIERSGLRMLNIINDIINISKIESHQTEITYSNTNVNEQIMFIYKFFMPEAAQKELHFSFYNELPEGDSFIRTDPEKLYAVLTNLVKNALKFSISGSVELGYEKKGNLFEFFVTDCGPGIPEGQKEFIFERFRQGSEKYERKYEGAGLGLSISKAYVEMLGGKIWVEDNFCKNGVRSGTKFLFTLPILPFVEDLVVQPAQIDHQTDKTDFKLNILIVDDDEFSEMLLIKFVEDYSENVYTARSGAEAIKFCKEHPETDLVLMDINMPGMDGYEATRRIRDFNKEVVIISQTAHTFAGERKKSMLAGCNDCIIKPINSTRLINMISTYFSPASQLAMTVNKK